MAFPSRIRTPGKLDLISRARIEADSVKAACTEMLGLIARGPISSTNLTRLAGAMAAINLEVTPVAEGGAELDEYAMAEYGKTITADATTLINAANKVLQVIKGLVPATEEGWLLVCKFDTDGTLAWRRYQTEELGVLVDAVRELINAID